MAAKVERHLHMDLVELESKVVHTTDLHSAEETLTVICLFICLHVK